MICTALCSTVLETIAMIMSKCRNGQPDGRTNGEMTFLAIKGLLRLLAHIISQYLEVCFAMSFVFYAWC